jgi:hypothetical protein
MANNVELFHLQNVISDLEKASATMSTGLTRAVDAVHNGAPKKPITNYIERMKNMLDEYEISLGQIAMNHTTEPPKPYEEPDCRDIPEKDLIINCGRSQRTTAWTTKE